MKGKQRRVCALATSSEAAEDWVVRAAGERAVGLEEEEDEEEDEEEAPMFMWTVLAVIVLFLIWAGWNLKGRSQSGETDVRADRDRRSGRYEGGNS